MEVAVGQYCWVTVHSATKSTKKDSYKLSFNGLDSSQNPKHLQMLENVVNAVY